MWRKAAFLIVLIMVAVPVLASGGESEGNPALGLLLRILNLVLFFGLLIYLAARPIRGFFEKHTEGIQEELAASLKREAEARRLEGDTQALFAGMDAELDKVRLKFQEERDRLKEDMRASTGAILARLKNENARAMIQLEEDLKKELRAYVYQKARAGSTEYLQGHLTAADRARFLDRVTGGR